MIFLILLANIWFRYYYQNKMKHYSRPLSLYEIDLLHYTSVGSDKEYFVDTLILKALDKDGNNIYKEQDKENLIKLSKSELESMYFEMFENELS